MNEISDRARDRVKMLQRACGIPEWVLLRVLLFTENTESEVLSWVEDQIELFAVQGMWPEAAGHAVAETICTSMGWTEPKKLGPQRGQSLEELTVMHQEDKVAFQRWVKKVNQIAGARVRG
jgi:hypothetical protein